MTVREISAAGFEALLLGTQLLQRARRADPQAGVFEAADLQWWWRSPRRSDEVEKPFWIDDEGPVAGVLVTNWSEETWQCLPVIVPGASALDSGVVWERTLALAAEHAPSGFEVPVSDSDAVFTELAKQSELAVGDQDGTGWLSTADRPALPPLPEGFVLCDRSQRPDTPHPFRHRNGDGVAERLGQCPLYDPSLDLAVEGPGGQIAAYSLYWFDPTTRVGLVEPVRVEDEFHRRGLGRAMVTAGVHRLMDRGAERVKVYWESDAAGALYLGIGFRQTSTATWYRARN